MWQNQREKWENLENLRNWETYNRLLRNSNKFIQKSNKIIIEYWEFQETTTKCAKFIIEYWEISRKIWENQREKWEICGN